MLKEGKSKLKYIKDKGHRKVNIVKSHCYVKQLLVRRAEVNKCGCSKKTKKTLKTSVTETTSSVKSKGTVSTCKQF